MNRTRSDLMKEKHHGDILENSRLQDQNNAKK